MYPVCPEWVPLPDSPEMAQIFSVDFNLDFDVSLDEVLDDNIDVPVTRQIYLNNRHIPLTSIDDLSENLEALSEIETDRSDLLPVDPASTPLPDSPTIAGSPVTRKHRCNRHESLVSIDGLIEHKQALSEMKTEPSGLLLIDPASIPLPDSPIIAGVPNVTVARKHCRERHAPLMAVDGLSEYMQAMRAPTKAVEGAGIPRIDYGNPTLLTALGSHAPTDEEVEWTIKLSERIKMRKAQAAKAAVNVENAIVMPGKKGLGSKDMRIFLGANIHTLGGKGTRGSGARMMVRVMRAGIRGLFSRR